jgi:hypothetical protein
MHCCRKLTINFIQHDCDFDNLKNVRIDIAAIDRWKNYQEYLVNNPGMNTNIIYKYFQALRHVHDEDKAYFDKIQYEISFGYRVPYYTSEYRYLKFVNLVQGFSRHLKVFKARSEEVRKGIQQFTEATNNPTLVEQLIEAGMLPRP